MALMIIVQIPAVCLGSYTLNKQPTLAVTVSKATITSTTRVTVDAMLVLTGVPATIIYGAGQVGQVVFGTPMTLNVLTNSTSGYELDVTMTLPTLDSIPVRTANNEASYKITVSNPSKSYRYTVSNPSKSYRYTVPNTEQWTWYFGSNAGTPVSINGGQRTTVYASPHRTLPNGDTLTVASWTTIPPVAPGTYYGIETITATTI